MLHPNEIKITDENRDVLMAEAEQLGREYILALKEQIQRQTTK